MRNEKNLLHKEAVYKNKKKTLRKNIINCKTIS